VNDLIAFVIFGSLLQGWLRQDFDYLSVFAVNRRNSLLNLV